MSIHAQAHNLGFAISGHLTPVEGRDSRCQYFMDDAGNLFIVRYGVLTIITASGKVY